ncbi:hypothetical protein [Egbenema bharatensis]|uniref:hypothetical protein n=1 Tax=Egbenema bharatensis TaxID=3463334 RepID=UPI003A89B187
MQQLLQEQVAQPNRLQIRCAVRDGVLLILVEHLLHVEPDPQKTFTVLERIVTDRSPGLMASDPECSPTAYARPLPSRIYIRVAGYQQPYAFHAFTIEPRSTEPRSTLPTTAPQFNSLSNVALPDASLQPSYDSLLVEPLSSLSPELPTEEKPEIKISEPEEPEPSDPEIAAADPHLPQAEAFSEPEVAPVEADAVSDRDGAELEVLRLDIAEPEVAVEAEPEAVELQNAVPEVAEPEIPELEIPELEIAQPEIPALASAAAEVAKAEVAPSAIAPDEDTQLEVAELQAELDDARSDGSAVEISELDRETPESNLEFLDVVVPDVVVPDIERSNSELEILQLEVREPDAELESAESEISESEAAVATERAVEELEVEELEISASDIRSEAEPEVAEAEAAEPGVEELEITESETAELQTELEGAESEISEIEVAESEGTELQAESVAANLESEVEVAEPEIAEPEIAEPEIAEPEETEPEAFDRPVSESERIAHTDRSDLSPSEALVADSPQSIEVSIDAEGSEASPEQDVIELERTAAQATASQDEALPDLTETEAMDQGAPTILEYPYHELLTAEEPIALQNPLPELPEFVQPDDPLELDPPVAFEPIEIQFDEVALSSVDVFESPTPLENVEENAEVVDEDVAESEAVDGEILDSEIVDSEIVSEPEAESQEPIEDADSTVATQGFVQEWVEDAKNTLEEHGNLQDDETSIDHGILAEEELESNKDNSGLDLWDDTSEDIQSEAKTTERVADFVVSRDHLEEPIAQQSTHGQSLHAPVPPTAPAVLLINTDSESSSSFDRLPIEVSDESRGLRSRVTLLGGLVTGAVGLFVVIGGVYVLTRPCVLDNECQPIQEAQRLSQRASGIILDNPSALEVVDAYDQLNQAKQLLEPIPFWSRYHGSARTLLSEYNGELDELGLVVTALNQANTAARKSLNPPHPVQIWREVQWLWRESINSLEQVPETSPVYALAQNKRNEYATNLESINHRIRIEQETQERIAAVQQASEVINARSSVITTGDSWQQALNSWQTLIANLEGIPQGTMAYGEAQRLIRVYQLNIQEIERRRERETQSADAYQQATDAAEQARLAEQREQWPQAATSWQEAVTNLRQIQEGTVNYSQAQALIDSYTDSFNQAEENAKRSTLLQTTTSQLDRACNGSRLCGYTLRANAIQVQIAPGYDLELQRAFTTAQLNGGNMAQANVSPQLNQLLRSLAAAGETAQVPIELYNAAGTRFGAYDPNRAGYILQ